jgi:ubiquinone/menaquinone biosynthesis C-methylase UbiE
MTALTEQAGKILGPLAGTTTVWGIDLALRLGILQHLATRPEGASAEQVATALGLDPLYTEVILRGCYAGEILESDRGAYRLAEHMDTLLLNDDAPGYLAGAVRTIVALRESYLDVRDLARTGEHEWWDDFDPEWIDAVGENGQTYYRRLLDVVVPQLPAVADRLARGARYLDLACGLCRGPAKVAAAYPETRVTAVDCDAYSLAAAEREMKARGIGDRFTFVRSFLETLDLEGGHDLAVINISLHEARDLRQAVARVHAALEEGGVFLVSEFPFPEDLEGVRTIPGRLMSWVQLFEAHIGCQLLPTARFVELLEQAGFRDVGAIPVTPMQVVVHGTK